MQQLKFNPTENNDQPVQYNGLIINSYRESDAGRATVEQSIRRAYRNNFNAHIQHFMPNLIAIAHAGDEAHLHFGLCAAAEHSLFLENYLPQPVERLLSEAVCSHVNRESIAEIGNLAFSHTENLQQDLVAMALYCQQQGYRYVVCTATRALRLLFLRAGMKPVHLGNAESNAVPCDGAHWGDYYQNRPQIIGGNILLTLQSLQSSL